MNNDIGVVGVMPGGAELYIVKVFNNAGDWVIGQSNLAAAAIACRNAGANAISMSLGGSYSATEDAIFQDLYDTYGIINIAAAGSDGTSMASYPASYDSVISVADCARTRSLPDSRITHPQATTPTHHPQTSNGMLWSYRPAAKVS